MRKHLRGHWRRAAFERLNKVLLLAASLAVRRRGESIGGLIVGLPLTPGGRLLASAGCQSSAPA